MPVSLQISVHTPLDPAIWHKSRLSLVLQTKTRYLVVQNMLCSLSCGAKHAMFLELRGLWHLLLWRTLTCDNIRYGLSSVAAPPAEAGAVEQIVLASSEVAGGGSG